MGEKAYWLYAKTIKDFCLLFATEIYSCQGEISFGSILH